MHRFLAQKNAKSAVTGSELAWKTTGTESLYVYSLGNCGIACYLKLSSEMLNNIVFLHYVKYELKTSRYKNKQNYILLILIEGKEQKLCG